jgi:hypothetical protein
VIGTLGPSAYWYLTRSTGVVSLVLLTVTMVLGVIDVERWSTRDWPRFMLDSLHRSVSLLVLVFVGLHIVTAVLDSFVPIALVDAVIPFAGRYRPLWLGLGTVAFDLLLALAITSVARQRLGYRAWRITHWLAYACWPVALVHGLGTGSDVKSAWSLILTAVCALAVLVAVGARALDGWPERRLLRGGALALTATLPIGLLLWLPGGPLGHGWARRAGTPATLLASSAGGVGASATSASPGAAGGGAAGGAPAGGAGSPSSGAGGLGAPFEATLSGRIAEGPGPAPGLVAVKIGTSFSGSAAGRLEIEIDGRPVGEGGVSLGASRVTLTSASTPAIYRGHVVALEGNRLVASVSAGGGRALSLQVVLAIAPRGGTVSGTLAASPASGR